MLERNYQPTIIKKLKNEYGEKNILILKNDSRYKQGIPDISVFYKNKYALLEIKRKQNASNRPNQSYYISFINDMGGFARRLCPENEKEVFNELRDFFSA